MSAVPVGFANEYIPCFDSALNQSVNFTSFTPLALPVVFGNVPLDASDTPVDLLFCDVSGTTNVNAFSLTVGQTFTELASIDTSGGSPSTLSLVGAPVSVQTDISGSTGLRLVDRYAPLTDFGTFAVGSSGTSLGWFDATGNAYSLPPSAIGDFGSLSNQTVTGASTPTPLSFDYIGTNFYCDISGGVPGTDVVVSNSGVYRLITHIQIDHAGVGQQPAIAYLTVNGSQLSNSSSYQTVAAAGDTHMTDEHILTIGSNDVVNVVLYSPEATMTATTTAATVDYPAVPSVAVTMNRIA